MELEGSLVNPAEHQQVSHFWVCSGPFFEVSLLAARPAGESGTEAWEPVMLRLFDADGLMVNEVNVQFSAGRIGLIELEPLMAACKLESGLKHAHLEISADPRWQFKCRLHSREGASMMGDPLVMTSDRRIFFPVFFSQQRFSFLCFVNHSASEAVVRARLFYGKRSPEASWTIPARGSRVVGVVDEFANHVEMEGEEMQAYIRLGIRGEQSVGAQLVERCRTGKESVSYAVIS